MMVITPSACARAHRNQRAHTQNAPSLTARECGSRTLCVCARAPPIPPGARARTRTRPREAWYAATAPAQSAPSDRPQQPSAVKTEPIDSLTAYPT